LYSKLPHIVIATTARQQVRRYDITHFIGKHSLQTGEAEDSLITPLKGGAIRPAAGGSLFALPIMYRAMMATIGSRATAPAVSLKKTAMNLT
jgi:hypothetical protein